MSDIAVLGAGAFGTALAVAQAAEARTVRLWARDADAVAQMVRDRAAPRLPGVALSAAIEPVEDLNRALEAPTVLLAIPAQAVRAFLAECGDHLAGRDLVACCKGIDIATGVGASGAMTEFAPLARHALLTGPSFAADIARGLPTALTLAARTDDDAARIQSALATRTLRLYRSVDMIGAELGGALKNVVAIAAGITVGLGLGDSARAAVITRGFAEMRRLSMPLGAQAETLSGLSGLGDLVLTCSSHQSRNFAFGTALGRGDTFDPSVTVEGAATAGAVLPLARRHGIDVPLTRAVAAVVAGDISAKDAARELLARPLRPE